MRDIECVSCEVRDGQVDIYDQDGNYINSIFEPNVENAYSNGRQVVVQSDDICVIYTVQRNGVIKRTADRFRSGSKSRKSSVDPDLAPKIENRPSGPNFSGCGTILILGCIVGLYNIIFSDSSKEKSPEQRPTAVVKKEYKGREYIREFIGEQKGCRIVAVTKQGGNVAICGNNGYACSGCPKGLIDALGEISAKGHRITDVCLTDKGKWVVLFGKNGYRSADLPEQMCNWLSKFHDDSETLLSATVNDQGDWVVISDKHFISSSTEIQNWLNEGKAKYWNILSVSITDDAGVAIFEGGRCWRGNYPEDLRKSIKESDFNPSVIRMAGDSWFYANESGKDYNFWM